MCVNFELYKVFYYVASYLSFSEAGKKLFISQSAVSQSIKSLENKLEVKLFYRSSKKVHLTKEGLILFKHIEPAFNLIKSGEKNIKEINSFTKGEIHIGASDTICKYFLLPYFKKFHQLYPHIHIQVTNRTSPKCVDLLKQGQVDFIITNLPNENTTNYMEITKISSFNDVFIAGTDFNSVKNKKIYLYELANYPILMLEKHTTTRMFFDKLFKDLNIKITPEIELSSIDLMIELARIGLGISFVPDYCFKNLNTMHDIFILNLHENIPTRHIGLVINKLIPLSISANKFIELITIS